MTNMSSGERAIKTELSQAKESIKELRSDNATLTKTNIALTKEVDELKNLRRLPNMPRPDNVDRRNMQRPAVGDASGSARHIPRQGQDGRGEWQDEYKGDGSWRDGGRGSRREGGGNGGGER